MYLLDPLVEHMPAVEAERRYWMYRSAMAPSLRHENNVEALDMLRAQLMSLYPPPPPVEPMPKEGPRDPEAAKAYFESMGVKVD